MSIPSPAIEFVLEEPTGRPRVHWPVTRGVPFPAGALASVDQLCLQAAGRDLPLQTRALAFWPDGSIKWVLLDFQVVLEPQSLGHYFLQYGSGVVNGTPPARPLIEETRPGQFRLDTGPLQANVEVGQGWGLLDGASLGGLTILDSQLSNPGLVLRTPGGEEFNTRQGKVTSAVVEVSGPLRAVLHLCGDHRSVSGERLFGYEARLSVYAGQPWVEVEYTFINDSDPEWVDLERISFELAPQAADSGLAGAYQDVYESQRPFSIYSDKPVVFTAFAGSRIFDEQGQHVELPEPGEMLHKVAHGWLDLSGEAGGLAVAVRRAGPLAPKRLASSGSRLQVELWPAQAGPLHWHQGWARTHRFLLYFHSGGGLAARANEICTCYEDDLLLWAPDWYVQSGVFGPLPAYQPRKYPGINAKLRGQLTGFLFNNRSLGLVNYGDHPQNAGGARANYMSNNEYDLAHSMALQFARTGERDYFEVMESTAWHMMDIDLIHHSSRNPLEVGGVRIHGDNHVQYNCEGTPGLSLASSHMWTEGLLEYYFLTGHPRALQMAESIGGCLLCMVDAGWGLPPYKVRWHSARDSGWPIVALTALYEATGEAKWLEPCHRIAQGMLDQQHPDGSWDLWLGWYNGNFTPLQIGIALTGLCRYHQVTGSELARAGLLKAAEAFLEKCSFPEGMLWYINAPGYRWNYACGVIIESLGYVWGLTGDQRYLDLGWNSFKTEMAVTSPTGTTLADSWRGLLRYMYWSDRAGFLTDL